MLRIGSRVAKVISIVPHANLIVESLFELLIIVAFLKAYNMTRNLFGSQACTPQYALGHAEQVIMVERLLGMFWEQVCVV